jgi:hypothetical protein
MSLMSFCCAPPAPSYAIRRDKAVSPLAGVGGAIAYGRAPAALLEGSGIARRLDPQPGKTACSGAANRCNGGWLRGLHAWHS